MKVKLVSDCWENNSVTETEFDKPSSEKLIESVNALDQKNYTMITLIGENNYQFVIGGGKGQYVCYIASDDGHFYSLTNPDDSETEEIVLNIGGQKGDYMQRKVVDKSTVIDAALYFSKENKPNEALSWELDD